MRMYFDVNKVENRRVDKKIIFMSPSSLKIKTEVKGVTSVSLINTENVKDLIVYVSPKNADGEWSYFHRYEGLFGQEWHLGWLIRSPYDQINFSLPDSLDDYPFYAYVGEGETETDEPATKTILFPPPETPEQFFERVWAKLLHLTRRIKILRHEEPHQNALSTNICREVPADHDEVLRYDIACNLIKRPCGWLALQLQSYQNRYNRHLEAVVKAQEAGRTPPTFNPGSDQTKIETMLERLETHLTEDCLQNHFDLHDHGEWDKIQNKQRKITLCEDDYSPGEVLVDVNAFFTDGRGNINEEHAKRTYHEISTKYWVMAKRTPHRELVTQRTVELD